MGIAIRKLDSTDAGFRLEQAMVVDQFLWSAHVELVGVFRR